MRADEPRLIMIADPGRPLDPWFTQDRAVLLAEAEQWQRISFRNQPPVFSRRRDRLQSEPCADASAAEETLLEFLEAPAFHADPAGRFATLHFWPLLQDVVAAAAVRADAVARLAETVRDDLLFILARDLAAVSHRVLFAAFDFFRSEMILSDPPVRGDAFQNFAAAWRQSRGRIVYQRWPCLARLHRLFTDQWLEQIAEVATQLAADRADLVSLGVPEQAVWSGISGGLSDRHHGGRGVWILSFADGARVVWKPRSLALDAAVSRLFAQWRTQSALAPLAPAVLDRGTCGWMEFMGYGESWSPDALQEWWRRAGALLGAMHLLAATDLHMDNLIATAQGPALIDMECLFQPMLPRSGAAAEVLLDLVEESVLRCGLLPAPERDARGQTVDISGFGGTGGYRQPADRTTYRNPGTAAMAAVKEPALEPPGRNVPRFADGSTAGPQGFAAEIEQGFRAALDWYGQHTTDLRRWLDEVEHLPVRVLLRPTSHYGLVQLRLTEPAAMESGFAAFCAIDTLAAPLCQTDSVPAAWAALRFEHQALRQFDIPVFHARAGGRDAMISDQILLPQVYGRSGAETAWRRLSSIGTASTEAQVLNLRRSLHQGSAHRETVAAVPGAESTGAAPEHSVRDAAALLARELMDSAVCDARGHIMWPGVAGFSLPGARGAGAALYLYDGAVGPAVALCSAEAAGVCRDGCSMAAGFTELVLAILSDAAAVSRLHREPVGAGTGLGSIVLGLSAVARLSGNGRAADAALQIVRSISPECAAAAPELDLLGGVAGWITALCGLHAVTRDAHSLQQAAATARLLCRRLAGESPQLPAGSLAHGTAGIALALCRLEKELGTGEFHALASPLLADALQPAAGMQAWCTGAPGLVIAAAACAADLQAPLHAGEAVSLLLGSGPTGSDFLCCGNAGRLDAALALSTRMPEVHDAVMVGGAALAAAAERGFRLDHGQTRSPGFFRGSAGILHVFCRMIAPLRVPDISAMRPLPAPAAYDPR